VDYCIKQAFSQRSFIGKKCNGKMYDIGVVIRENIKNDMNKDILKYIAQYFNSNVKNVELQKKLKNICFDISKQ